MAIKEHKLDIFDVLRNIDTKKRGYYQSLSDEEQKALSPFVIMRWLTGTSSARQVYFINEIVNPYAFSLQNHKDLIVKLMMICTSGRSQRYQWLKQPKKSSAGASKLVDLVSKYFNYSSRHAAEALPLLSDDDLLSYATQLGYQKPELTAIKREMKKRDKV